MDGLTSNRRDRSQRRNLNSQEMHDMGYAELRENADEDGWAYPDDDDDETTDQRGNESARRDDRRRSR